MHSVVRHKGSSILRSGVSNGNCVKRWLSSVWRVALLVLLVVGTACAPSGTVITVEPAASSLQINQTTRALVTVDDVSDLTAFEVHLSFDANALEVVELNDGGFLKPDFIIQNTFDNAAGTIDYAVAQLDPPPAKGSGTLFEIVFRAKAQGEFPIVFRDTPAVPDGALMSDSQGRAIEFSSINTSIQIRK